MAGKVGHALRRVSCRLTRLTRFIDFVKGPFITLTTGKTLNKYLSCVEGPSRGPGCEGAAGSHQTLLLVHPSIHPGHRDPGSAQGRGMGGALSVDPGERNPVHTLEMLLANTGRAWAPLPGTVCGSQGTVGEPPAGGGQGAGPWGEKGVWGWGVEVGRGRDLPSDTLVGLPERQHLGSVG